MVITGLPNTYGQTSIRCAGAFQAVNSSYVGSSDPALGSTNIVNADGRLASQYRYDYAGRCWWCGQTADTGEHKFKRTDLVREFGSGPWRGSTAVSQLVGDREYTLQSPGSQRLKFSTVFCGDCNSSRSQSFDFAYDDFSSYMMLEKERILSNMGFRWSGIFGRQWKDGRNLVTAYWLKHIGCRLADAGVKVDPRIIRFLYNPGQIRAVPLRMELQVRADWLELDKNLQSSNQELRSFWMDDLMCEYSSSRQQIVTAIGNVGSRWLGLVYKFDLDSSGP